MKNSMLSISSIEITPAEKANKYLLAYVSLIIDGCFLVKDVKLIQGHQGMFVAMPAQKGKDGKFHDIVHPLNQETRDFLERKVIEKYQEFIGQNQTKN